MMKNINILTFLLIYLTFSSATCRKKDIECSGESHSGLTVFNNSYKRINFTIYWNYPDTIIGEYNPRGSGVIYHNESRTRGAGPNSCWESILKGNKKEYLYIFDEDSLQTIPWEIVRKTNRGLLERREISLSYLQSNDFIIRYP